MSRALRHIADAESVNFAIEQGGKFLGKCGAKSRPRPGLDRPTCSTCVDLAMAEREETVLKLTDTIERLQELEQLFGCFGSVFSRANDVLSRQGPALPDGIPNEPAEGAVSVESAAVNGCGKAEDPDRGPDPGMRFTAAETIAAGARAEIDQSTGYLRAVRI